MHHESDLLARLVSVDPSSSRPDTADQPRYLADVDFICQGRKHNVARWQHRFIGVNRLLVGLQPPRSAIFGIPRISKLSLQPVQPDDFLPQGFADRKFYAGGGTHIIVIGLLGA